MENILKLILSFIFIVFVSFLIYEIFEQARSDTYERLDKELTEVREGNDRIEAANNLLRVRIEAIRSDPRAIERKVRDELGMARPDEVIILLKNYDEPVETVTAAEDDQ